MQEKGHIAWACQASLACKILAQSCMILQVRFCWEGTLCTNHSISAAATDNMRTLRCTQHACNSSCTTMNMCVIPHTPSPIDLKRWDNVRLLNPTQLLGRKRDAYPSPTRGSTNGVCLSLPARVPIGCEALDNVGLLNPALGARGMLIPAPQGGSTNGGMLIPDQQGCPLGVK